MSDIKSIFKRDYKAIMFLFCFLFIATAFNKVVAQNSSNQNKPDYILIINSYTEASDWSNTLIRPVFEWLFTKKHPLVAYTEQMNMLILETEEQVTNYKTYLFDKYKNVPPKAIVILGNSPWALLKEDLEAKWVEVPVILCAGENYIGPKENYLYKTAIPKDQQVPFQSYHTPIKLTVLSIPYYLKETVALMKEIQPEINRILFLSDSRYISAQNRNELAEVIQKNHPEIHVSYFTPETISLNELADTLRYANRETGILFMSWYKKTLLSGYTDISSNDYKMFSRYTSRPIFTLDDSELVNSGMLGGYFYSRSSIAKMIYRALETNLIKKTQSSYTPINSESPSTVINYLALTEKGISSKLCPENTVFYQKSKTVWELYKYEISITVLIILLVFIYLAMKMQMLSKIKKEQNKQLKLMKDYRSLFENMPIAYSKQQLIYDNKQEITDYIVREINPYYEKDFPSQGTVVGKRGSELGNNSFKDYLNLYKIAIDDKKEITVQYYYQKTNKYFSMIMAPSKIEGYIDLFYVDNTELAQAQQQLQTVNYKLSMALEVANITPWKWDLEKKTILCDVNRSIELNAIDAEAAETQLSVPDALYFSKICKRDLNRVRQAYQELIDGKVNKIKEEYRVFVHQDNKNSYEWVEAQAVIDKRDKNGKPLSLIGSSQVISDRKKLEEDLINAKEKAEESNRLKSAFLANMSHEIRTPLNAIVGFSEVLASSEDETEKHEYVSIIENNNTLLLQLISDILDLSKIEAGTLDFNNTDIDLNALFRELESSSQMRVSDSVQIIYEKQMPKCTIRTDKNRVTQVIMNLINNAIKFTSEGSIRFGYTLREDKFLYIYVSDTGCGIPEDKTDSVFGRFIKLNSFAQGTGLGLSICQTIINHMGGEIGVNSKEGVGSTFWFTLPYEPVTLTNEPHAEYPRQKIERDKLTVLIAEDNASNFKLFEAILAGEYHTLHAWDGEEAVQLFEKYHPHIVLMDINMPKMNGYEATKAIRALSDRVPIIAVTAYAYASDEQQILNSGFNGYTAKPINPQMLKSQMTNLLKRQLIFM